MRWRSQSVYYSNSGNLIDSDCDIYTGAGVGALRLCFHECAAGIFVDPLQKIISRESSYDWRKIVLNINMISIVIGVGAFLYKDSSATAYQ